MPRQQAQKTEVPEEIALFQQLTGCIQQNQIEPFKQLVATNPGILKKVINVQGSERYKTPTLLQIAIDNECGELASFILQQDPETAWLYVSKCNYYHADNKSPYEYVFEKKKREWIKRFCENGADINHSFTQQNGYSVVEQTPLRIAIEEKDDALTEFLLSKPQIDFKKRFGGDKETYLHIAAGIGNTNAARLLIKSGVSVHWCTLKRGNYRDFEDKAPLHYAAENGYIEIIKLLLESQADINEPDDLTSTPLHSTLRNKKEEAALFLLKNGAILDCWDETLSKIQNQWKRVNCMHTMHMAAQSGLASVLTQCCEQCPTLVNEKDYSTTSPLFYAVTSGSLAAVEVLCGYGADLVATGCVSIKIQPCKNEYIEMSTIECAVFKGNDAITFYLLDRIATEKDKLFEILGKFKDAARLGKLSAIAKQLIEKHKLSAIEFAKLFIKYGQVSALNELFDAGLIAADYVDETTGDNLLHFAAYPDQYAVAQLLVDKGAIAKLNKANMLPSSLFKIPAASEVRERTAIKAVIQREHDFIKPLLRAPAQPKWVKSLNVRYENKNKKPEKSIEIPGDSIHAALANNDTFLDENLEQKRGNENYLTAVITFVVSGGKYQRENPQSKKLIHVPIKISDKEIVSFTDKSVGWEFRNGVVLNSFAGLDVEKTFDIHDFAHNKTTVRISRYEDSEEYIFNYNYYHSEQLLLHFLMQETVITEIARQLIAQGLVSGSKLYAMSLDGHSSLMPCPDCEMALSSYDQAAKFSQSILPLLMTCLEEQGVTLVCANNGVRIVTRMGARDPYPKYVERKPVAEYSEEIVNINTRGEGSTLLLRDNMQICPNVYATNVQPDPTMQQFLVAMDAELTFFRSGSGTSNLKKRKRDDEGDILSAEQVPAAKRANTTQSPAPQ